MDKSKRFFLNTIILTVTSLVLRTIAVVFNIYVSNRIGFAGMGLMELIMSIFSFAVILAMSGIGLTTTRLVAEELAAGSHKGIKKVMRSCITYTILFGTGSAIILLASANFIGCHILNDERTVKCLYIAAISLPFMAMQSAFYGYFTAVRRISKSSIIQIVEQIIRITLTVILLNLLLHKGIEYSCVAVVGASALTEIIILFIFLIVYRHDLKRYSDEGKEPKTVRKRLLSISLPIAFSSYICSALYTIKSIMIPLGLVKYGLTKEMSLAQFGIISGMVLPLIMFPQAFLSAFSSLIVPEITECYRLNKYKRIDYIVSRAIQITLIFSIGIIGLFICFPDDFGITIFKNIQIGTYIRILAPIILISYLDSVVDAMLKGLNEQVSSMFFNIFDSLFCIILVYILLPLYGMKGLLFVLFAGKLVNTFLSVYKITKISNFQFRFISWVIKPIFAITISVLSVKLTAKFIHSAYYTSYFILFVYVSLSMVLYYFILRYIKCINDDDLKIIKNIFRHNKT